MIHKNSAFMPLNLMLLAAVVSGSSCGFLGRKTSNDRGTSTFGSETNTKSTQNVIGTQPGKDSLSGNGNTTSSEWADSLSLLQPFMSSEKVSAPCPEKAGKTAEQQAVTGCLGKLNYNLPVVGALGLVYDSYNPDRAMGVGHGWAFSIDSRLTNDAVNKRLTLATSAGRQYVFKYDETKQIYQGDSQAIALSFKAVGNDEFEATDEANNTIRFKRIARSSYGLSNLINRDSQLTISRGATGEITSVKTQNGTKPSKTLQLTYDQGLVQSLAVEGTSATFVYDANGFLTQVAIQAREIATLWSMTYDTTSKLLGAIYSSTGENQRFSYYQWESGGGAIWRVVDRTNHATNFSYTKNTVTTQSVSGKVTSYYNDAGYLVGMEQNGLKTTYERDSDGRVTKVTDPFGRAKEYTYDATTHRLTTSKDLATDTLSTFTYDDKDHLLALKMSRGDRSINYRYTYDEKDNLVQSYINDIPAGPKLTYNDNGQVVRAQIGEKTLSERTFDDKGNIKSVTNVLGLTSSYSFDEDGNSAQVNDALNGTTTLTKETTANGGTVTVSLPDGSTVSRSQDGAVTKEKVVTAKGNTEESVTEIVSQPSTSEYAVRQSKYLNDLPIIKSTEKTQRGQHRVSSTATGASFHSGLAKVRNKVLKQSSTAFALDTVTETWGPDCECWLDGASVTSGASNSYGKSSNSGNQTVP